jgi:RNA ligase partner protein
MTAPRVLVLDTSLFVNPASSTAFGGSPTDAFTGFLRIAARLDGVDFLMPPSVYTELMHFAEEPKIPKDLLVRVRQQAPKKNETKVPGIFIHKLVDQMRDRTDRALRLAERTVRDALMETPPPAAAPGDKGPRADAEWISRLRESYRRIAREGMLDSAADADLLLLSYETGGTLVSADLGVMAWAAELGVETLPYDQFPAFLAGRARPA